MTKTPSFITQRTCTWINAETIFWEWSISSIYFNYMYTCIIIPLAFEHLELASETGVLVFSMFPDCFKDRRCITCCPPFYSNWCGFRNCGIPYVQECTGINDSCTFRNTIYWPPNSLIRVDYFKSYNPRVFANTFYEPQKGIDHWNVSLFPP